MFLVFIATYDLFIKKQILAETEYKLIAETLKGMFEHPRHLKVSKKCFLITYFYSEQISKHQYLHFPVTTEQLIWIESLNGAWLALVCQIFWS